MNATAPPLVDVVMGAVIDAVIDARQLIKRYGDRTVVAGVDLTVRSGEVLCLLGPNGAGKTTTVDLLVGFRKPDGGSARVLGTDPWQAGPTHRARIGVVSQQTLFTDELTVSEFLGAQSSCFARTRPIDEVLGLVGLAEHAGQRVPKLSGGQARRLDVACGIVGRPELLFLDEPTTGFDPEARRQFWELIRLLRDEGTTILLTTHYLDEAEALADRVAVMIGGQIRAIGTPAELRASTSTEAVLRYRSADGVAQELRTATPTEALRRLLAEHAGEIADLTVTRPTLEDTYLDLVEASA